MKSNEISLIRAEILAKEVYKLKNRLKQCPSHLLYGPNFVTYVRFVGHGFGAPGAKYIVNELFVMY